MIIHEPIATGRLVLRGIEISDAPRIHSLVSNWNVLRTLSSPPYPYKPENAREFVGDAVERHKSGNATVLLLMLDQSPIGTISIEPRRRGAMLGYWLGEDYWGRGYMTEAATALVRAFFKSGSEERMVSGYFAGNGASWRIQDKLGFRIVGEGMLHSRPWGKELPHVDTELTRARFQALQS
jgi:RimJ/RimL family protein N-acetyltransferase